MIAYALGDRLAWLATLLQHFDAFGFWPLVFGWSVVAGICILPAAVVSGYQFPLLIALMGTGRKHVGGDVGAVYAWNTVGAIAGSLAGGFFLMPLMTATGCWRLVGMLLMLLGLAAMVLLAVRSRSLLRVPASAALAVLAFALTHFATGPTAAWRHSGVGVGRADISEIRSRNAYREWVNEENCFLLREMEGVESCVGVSDFNAYAFIVNGKSDGNSIGDAPTQVMSGVLGAILHPNPKSAMVIGLGSGSTAGWLANVPSIERVDCAELEPAILEFARLCAPVNANAMNNPKLHVTIGDARELLMTNPHRYDLIFSEPSNPYRAGIASLFTREYYESVVSRLNDDGLFVQWMQDYDVQSRTVQTVYATLQTTFPYVETWQGCRGDLLLVASKKPVNHDIAFLRNRIAQDEFRVPLLSTWHVNDLEGFYAHYVASTAFAQQFASLPGGELNTDDRIVIEFGFARGVSLPGRFSINEMRDTARDLDAHRPHIVNGTLDWTAVHDEIMNFAVLHWDWPTDKVPLTDAQKQRLYALQWYVENNPKEALERWRKQPDEPRGPIQIAVVAWALASWGDEGAMKYIDALRKIQPGEADAILGHLYFAKEQFGPAADAVAASFERYRKDPWPMRPLMALTMDLAVKIAEEDATLGRRLFDAVREPFVVRSLQSRRCRTLLAIARAIDDDTLIRDAMRNYEPYIPWNAETLDDRAEAYASTRDPLADRANADRDAFEDAQTENLLEKLSDLIPSTKPATRSAAR
jgi:hypothetical protein